MRRILALSLFLFLGCASPLIGPDRTTVKAIASVGLLEVTTDELDQYKIVTITDTRLIDQFAHVYESATWKPYFATTPVTESTIAGYSDGARQFRIVILGNRLLQLYENGDMREGILREEDREWFHDHIVAPHPDSTTTIKYIEREYRVHGGVI